MAGRLLATAATAALMATGCGASHGYSADEVKMAFVAAGVPVRSAMTTQKRGKSFVSGEDLTSRERATIVTALSRLSR